VVFNRRLLKSRRPSQRTRLQREAFRRLWLPERLEDRSMMAAGDYTVRLEITDALGTPIAGPVAQNSTIHLRGFVEDTRAVPQGVFSAYLDVLFTPDQTPGTPTFGPDWPAAQTVPGVDESGAVRHIGALDDGTAPVDPGAEVLLFDLPFTMIATGNVQFSAALPSGGDEVLFPTTLYGNVTIQPGDVTFISDSITVLPPGVTVSPISGDTTEAGGTATFTVVLDAPPTDDVTISLLSDNTSEGTTSAASLTFTTANWDSPQTVTVTGVDDTVSDGNITYHIVTGAAVSTDANYSGLTVADVTVVNLDDELPEISVAVAPSSVTEDGAGTLVYTFTRSGDTTSALTVNFSVSGTATFTTDYGQTGAASFDATTGTVTFAAGSDTATVTLDPVPDTTAEGDETAVLTVATGTGYTIGTAAAATGTIADDDGAEVTVAVAPASVTEDGAGALVYTFTRVGDTTNPLTVNFSVSGSATFTTDYGQTGAASFTGAIGTVTFAAGSDTATVTLTPVADTTVENDETAVLTVTTGTGYTIGTAAAATGTITNDDGTAVSVTVAPASVTEDGAGTLVYTFTRIGDTTGALTVDFTVGGDATFNTDYTQTGAASFTATTGTVTFAAGSDTALVTLDPSADTDPEGDETAILTVTAGTGYAVGAAGSATGTIANDDGAEVTVAVAPASVAEDGAGTLVYTFTRTGDTTSALTVNFSVGGTATFTTDYGQTGAASFTGTNGTVTFAAGSDTATITLDPVLDTTVENDETAVLTVTTGAGYTVGTANAATGTITNDDGTEVTVAVAPTSVLEDGAGTLVYTFTRVGDTSAALTVSFTVGGTATFTTDYAQTGAATFDATTGTVTFAAGSDTATVTLDPVTDAVAEGNETAILTVTTGTGYTVGATAAATGTITDDDGTEVTVAVAPASVTEDGAGNLVYTFTRAGDTSSALTVNFTVGGTATFATDYNQTGAATFNGTTGTVTFAAGASTATVTLDPTVDTTPENSETAVLTLTSGAGYTIGASAAATGTITNDDGAAVSVTVAPASVTEDGAGTLVYTFTRVGDTTNVLTVNFTVGGGATFNTDYTQTGAAAFTATTGSVTFAAGSDTVTVTLDPTSDTTPEGDETAVLTVVAGAGYAVGSTPAATGTIANDDGPSITVAVAPSSVAEDGAGTLVYTFTRVGDSSSALTVNFSVSGTAAFTSDYSQAGAASFTATAGTVTFAAGSSTATVTLDPVVDSTPENDETAVLTLTSGTGYTVGAANAATGTITNDDGTAVSVAVSPSSVVEDGSGTLVYTFTRIGDTTGALTVNFSVGGAATFTTDYGQTGAASFTGTTGTVTFAAGSSTATVTLDPVADTTSEPNETAILTVTAGTGYTVGATPAATGTITDDDTSVTVAVAPASVAEDGAGKLVYTFTRTGDVTNALTINIGVSGTATSGTDYSGITGTTVTFAAGANTATLELDPTQDNTVEPDETAIITINAGTGYSIGAAASATGTITNDDSEVTISVSPASIAEDGTGVITYTFTRTGNTTNALTVNFALSGTATSGQDYTSANVSGANTTGTVTFAAGSSTATLTIDPTADSVVEPDETVIVTITGGNGYTPATVDDATATITNDDVSVTVAVSPTGGVNEDSTGTLVYTFTRTGDTTNALTVNFGLGGTATSGTDYVVVGGTTGSVTFAAGSATATLTIDPTADTVVESDETVIVSLQAGTGYSFVSGASATGTILNDDASVTVAVQPASVLENGSGALVYTFTRTGNTTGALTVNFSIGGTATAGTDYTGLTGATGQVTFAAGQSTATVILAPVGDTTVESNETVVLTITSGVGYSIGSTAAATGTITDDDGFGSLSGVVFLDSNGNGVTDVGEIGIPNVTITVQGTGAGNSSVTQTVTTNAAGGFTFSNLPVGTYNIIETQPAAFRDGGKNVISATVTASGSASGNVFAELGIQAELISIRMFLASTPSDAALVQQFSQLSNNVSALRAAPAAATTFVTAQNSLPHGSFQMNTLVEAASRLWAKAGASAAQVDHLRNMPIAVANLGGDLLATTSDRGITLDDDANGQGWFIDPTPLASEEFSSSPGGLAASSSKASGMDLLTVLAHEMGHVLGLDHQSTSDKLASVMQETLAAGLRREPQASDFDHILAEETNWLL
jgi:hypothetical protein